MTPRTAPTLVVAANWDFGHDEAVALPGVVDCVLVLAVEELWLEEFAELTT